MYAGFIARHFCFHHFSRVIIIIICIDEGCKVNYATALLSFNIIIAMDNKLKNVSRKKFLGWGIGISSLLAIPSFLLFPKKEVKEIKTAKMLTQDGRLVEVDISNLPSKKIKIKPNDVHTWVNKKNASL